jgi:hypothetical protein
MEQKNTGEEKMSEQNQQINLKAQSTERLALLLNNCYQQIMQGQQGVQNINAELQLRENQNQNEAIKNSEVPKLGD